MPMREIVADNFLLSVVIPVFNEGITITENRLEFDRFQRKDKIFHY